MHSPFTVLMTTSGIVSPEISVLCIHKVMVSKKFLLRFRHIAMDSDQESPPQSTYIYKEYHSVCLLVGIGIIPSPLSLASVPRPPESG
jgi:hypothetical protein